MSAYETGALVGMFVSLFIGASAIFRGYKLWLADRTPQESIAKSTFTGAIPTRDFGTAMPPAPAPPPASPSPMPSAPVPSTTASGGDDFFFGGTITPATATTTPPTSAPASEPDTRWHPNYSAAPAPAGTSRSGSGVKGIAIMLVGVLVLGWGLYRAYDRVLAPSKSIEMPETLMGLPQSEVSDQMIAESQDQMDAATGIFDRVELEGAVYTDGKQVLYVLAGEEGTTDPSDIQEFKSGFEAAGTNANQDISMVEMDAGALGGKMWCTDDQVQGVDICAWLDADTFGAILMGGQGVDLKSSAHDIREKVEH